MAGKSSQVDSALQETRRQLAAMGQPPNPKQDANAYKAFMRRKYELEAAENSLMLKAAKK
jgi:hypothetical protein